MLSLPARGEEGGQVAVLVAEVMRRARAKTRLSQDGMAASLNHRIARAPGLLGASIHAFEAGIATPPLDVYIETLELAGIDARRRISEVLRLLRSEEEAG